jgi:YD repeat-containing protein
VQTTYNTLGEVTQVTQPFLVGATTQPATQYLYDALGRVTQKTAPDGSVVTHGSVRISVCGAFLVSQNLKYIIIFGECLLWQVHNPC